MATQVEVKQALDQDLHRLTVELEDLPALAEEWEDTHESVRYDAELTWYGAMVGLRERLDPAYRAGQMTPLQAERYRQLLQALQDALPFLQQLGFTLPQISLQP